MNLTIFPGKLSGSLCAIPSKSQAHRILICAAFADAPSVVQCAATNQDIEATAGCMRSLGAQIQRTAHGYHIIPIQTIPDTAVLDCGESGSTLRFLLPVCAALGIDTVFQMSGRLPMRPLSPLWEELERMGCHLTRPTESTIRCQGQLISGAYSISGQVSSQFITGLMFALALLTGKSTLTITGTLESKPYVDLTRQVISLFGMSLDSFPFDGNTVFHTPGTIAVEGDWSNAAFFLTAQALGNPVNVSGLSPQSVQGDRAVVEILNQMDQHCTVDGRDIPDLIPILAVAATAKNGAVFENIGRLRLKESDRIEAVVAMLTALGGKVTVNADQMTVFPSTLTGGVVDARNDHRIAMAAAIASTVCTQPVTILGAQCVQKSYPDFWSEFSRLGGNYEQYIR